VNPNMNRKRGKATERYLAKRTGAQRLGIMGKDDLRDGTFSYEIKNRMKSTAHGFMEQAKRNCAKGKIPIVIIHKHGQEHGKDLVCMELAQWEMWNGKITRCQ